MIPRWLEINLEKLQRSPSVCRHHGAQLRALLKPKKNITPLSDWGAEGEPKLGFHHAEGGQFLSDQMDFFFSSKNKSKYIWIIFSKYYNYEILLILLLNQTEIWLYLLLSDWCVTKRAVSVVFQNQSENCFCKRFRTLRIYSNNLFNIFFSSMEGDRRTLKIKQLKIKV